MRLCASHDCCATTDRDVPTKVITFATRVRRFDTWPECRPGWAGSLLELIKPKASNVQGRVGAAISFEEFKKVSGVAAITAATAQLNARLAARGARPHLPGAVHESCVLGKRASGLWSCRLLHRCKVVHSNDTRVRSQGGRRCSSMLLPMRRRPCVCKYVRDAVCPLAGASICTWRRSGSVACACVT